MQYILIAVVWFSPSDGGPTEVDEAYDTLNECENIIIAMEKEFKENITYIKKCSEY